MPTRGLSLVGFMNSDQAVAYFRQVCGPYPRDKSDTDLVAEWTAAQAGLGAALPKPGNPELEEIGFDHPYIQELVQVPWSPVFEPLLAEGATFKMVEIDPLLVLKFTVDTERSNSYCGSLEKPLTERQLFETCLPLGLSRDPIYTSRQANSMIIKSRNSNLGIIAHGMIQNPAVQNLVGIQFSWTNPFVQVIRFNGRCILHNGYHRAYGLRMAGATHMPCIFREVPDAAAASIRTDGTTFSEALLYSPNAPTIGHFTQGRAFPVTVRASTRIIQVSWSQHMLFDE